MSSTRIFFSDNGTLSDWTNSLNVYGGSGVTFTYTVNEDYIYIGQNSPFNHIYIKLGATVNAVTAALTAEYWNGVEWIAAVETVDETSVGGKTLAQSGFVSFAPNRNKLWESEDTNFEGGSISGLTNVVIYDLYWMRLKINATLTPAINIQWMGYKFCTDNDLAIEYPDLGRQAIRDSFFSGKTTYEEQIIRASELIVNDLVAKNVLDEVGNILVREQFKLPCVAKLAEIIFHAMGDDYRDDKLSALAEYNKRMNLVKFKVDKDNDAILSPKENAIRSGYLTRG